MIGKKVCSPNNSSDISSENVYDMPMAKERWTYMLRIEGRNPDAIPMERLGEYLTEFAKLLGLENQPRFEGVQVASTGLMAYIPPDRVHYTNLRLVKATDPACINTEPAKHFSKINKMLGVDGIKSAQLLNTGNDLVYQFPCLQHQVETVHKLNQKGVVDGTVVGIVGADDTAHVRLLNIHNKVLNLVVKDAELAKNLAQYFKGRRLRLSVEGTWVRTENGWLPETGKCYVQTFDPLEETGITKLFDTLQKIPNNGWANLAHPIQEWKNIRGIA